MRVGVAFEEATLVHDSVNDIYQFNVFDGNHRPLCLDQFRDRALLITNISLRSEHAEAQIAQLQSIHKK